MKVQSLYGDKPNNQDGVVPFNCKAILGRFSDPSLAMSQEGILKLEIMTRLRPSIVVLLNSYDTKIVEQYAQNIAHWTCVICAYHGTMTQATCEMCMNQIRTQINNLTLFLRENFNISSVTVGLNELINNVLHAAVSNKNNKD